MFLGTDICWQTPPLFFAPCPLLYSFRNSFYVGFSFTLKGRICPTVLIIYCLITFADHFQWRASRAISRGVSLPTLRATPGAYAGLRLCRTPCDVALRQNPASIRGGLCRIMQSLVKLCMTSTVGRIIWVIYQYHCVILTQWHSNGTELIRKWYAYFDFSLL